LKLDLVNTLEQVKGIGTRSEFEKVDSHGIVVTPENVSENEV
jgi:hypothetical protein